MSDDELNLECDVTFEDIITWNRYFLDNNPMWQRRVRKIRAIGFPLTAVLLAVGIILLVLNVLIGGILAIAIGILGIVALLVFPVAVWKKFEKYLREKYCYVPHKDVGRHTYEITEEGLRIVTGKGATRLRWIEVKSVTQTGDYIYIDIPPYSSVIIPRCSFNDDAAFDRTARELSDMFQRHKSGDKA